MNRWLSVLSVFAIGFVAASAASAGVIIQTPAGLRSGDHFRIAFITSGTIDATSSDVSTYDRFVTDQADHATYGGQLVSWQAIVSTPTVNAKGHIGVTHAPIFLVDGTQVAPDDSKIFGFVLSGQIYLPRLDHSINLDIHETRIEDVVWTGTNLSTAVYDSLNTRTSLGGGNMFATIGVSSAPPPGRDYYWLTAIQPGFLPYRTIPKHLYGISSELVAIPEPSTAMLFGLGGLVAWAYSIKRKRT